MEYISTRLLFSAGLKLVPGKKFTLIGTPQGNEIKDPSRLCPLLFHTRLYLTALR
jgi:hypothetical protein